MCIYIVMWDNYASINTFYSLPVQLFCNLYKSQKGPSEARVFHVPADCAMFRRKFNDNQRMLRIVTGHDDLVSGILSKQKGQILRLAAICHCLFRLDVTRAENNILSDEDIAAAVDFIEVCSDHTCCIAGKSNIVETIDRITSGLMNAIKDNRSSLNFQFLDKLRIF